MKEGNTFLFFLPLTTGNNNLCNQFKLLWKVLLSQSRITWVNSPYIMSKNVKSSASLNTYHG